ncbi:histidine kinase [Luteolibacter sp. GHJ8]|uniref:Histidine kinase n=1 Tax=Luteolibacter rhizosphaerae TaxID=2989719 RepID=A0ABT3G3D1_9BACT|nr:two-component regulator propeller domain-containing protein [Luteolibacter rhizosphaerae]MCW1914049.1 histidine kinase [Luteolibacter rhizosphaerae]
MRLYLLVLLLLLRVSIAQGESRLLVRQWQSEDGLPGNVVRSVIQSRDGYLWVATAEGVARFDGIEFEPIELDGRQRRSRFAFWRLYTSGKNDVWVATFQGGLFLIRDGKFERVLPDAIKPRPPLVTQLLETKQGEIHIKRGEEFHRIENGIAIEVAQPADAIIESFHRDFADQARKGRREEPAATPRLEDRDGGTWAEASSGGLELKASDGTVLPVLLPGAGSPVAANELLEDREGNVWVASPINGLIRVKTSRVEVLDKTGGLSDNAIFAVMQASSGEWWLANRSGGITRWTPQGSEQIDLVPGGYHRAIGTLFEDRDRTLWAAAREGSVFTGKDGVFKTPFAKTQVPSKVRTIHQDSSGTLWFGGSQGLASLKDDQVQQHAATANIPEPDITVIGNGGKSGIVFGTADGQVLLGSPGRFRPLGASSDLQHRWISGIHLAAENEVWASTLGSGLFLWNGKRWHSFGSGEGLPDERLTCLLDDGRGQFWFGSLGGILRANRKELLQRIKDPEAPLHWLRLDRSDGLPSRECIGGYQPAGWKASDGRLWFPTGNGIVRVRPELVEINKVAPPVYLRSIRVNGMQHDATGGNIEAGPGRSRVEFRFVGLGYSAPEKITYRARMSGLDDVWRELGTQRIAAFEAVPPGRYTFEVMAVNGDGIRSDRIASVKIVIRPHFWETAWFLISASLCVLLVAAAAGWLLARRKMKRRIEKLRIRNAREAERSRIARDLHDDLGASLTEISILAALAAEDATGSPFHPPLDQLSSKAKGVVGALDEIVWAVNPREDTLRSLVEYIAAFAREFLDIARIPLRSEVMREIPDRPLATTERHSIFLAAREALNNVVKHSASTEVKLKIVLENDTLGIHIEDNGKGFHLDYARGGDGLGNLERRMAEAGGTCHIETAKGRGTTVILNVPLLDRPGGES